MRVLRLKYTVVVSLVVSCNEARKTYKGVQLLFFVERTLKPHIVNPEPYVVGGMPVVNAHPVNLKLSWIIP